MRVRCNKCNAYTYQTTGGCVVCGHVNNIWKDTQTIEPPAFFYQEPIIQTNKECIMEKRCIGIKYLNECVYATLGNGYFGCNFYGDCSFQRPCCTNSGCKKCEESTNSSCKKCEEEKDENTDK